MFLQVQIPPLLDECYNFSYRPLSIPIIFLLVATVAAGILQALGFKHQGSLFYITNENEGGLEEALRKATIVVPQFINWAELRTFRVVDPDVVGAQRAVQSQQGVEINNLDTVVDRVSHDAWLLGVYLFENECFCGAIWHYKLW